MTAPDCRDSWLRPTLEGLVGAGALARLDACVRDSYWEACVAGGFATDSGIAQALGARFRMPVADTTLVSARARDVVPEALARRYRVLPLAATDTTLDVATADPHDVDAERAIAFATGRAVRLSVAAPACILARLDEVYRQESVAEGILEGVAGQFDVQEILDVGDSGDVVPDDALERPVMRLVDHIVGEAIAARASDIHVETEERGIAVRCRIDGVLRQTMALPKGVGGPLVSRVKIMARLDIADRLRPQDGRARVDVHGRPVDLRISTLPSAHGEKLVIRILDQQATVLSLDVLGMLPLERSRVERLLSAREGLVLVTGPTGSGKTTTLYSMLRRVQERGVNVVTVEDPVEYRLDGIVQVQVHEKAGLTFAAALRSILRQDPDVILVGEIRDRETAQIAVQAALTGHLVFSTLHTIDAGGAVARLADLGVESFKLAAALKGVIAQRLLRRLCVACRAPESGVPDRLRNDLGDVAPMAARGCGECRSTGYSGRLAASEVLVTDGDVERRIAAGEPVERIVAAARAAGMRSLWEAGLAHVIAGSTSVDELLRVVEPSGNLPVVTEAEGLTADAAGAPADVGAEAASTPRATGEPVPRVAERPADVRASRHGAPARAEQADADPGIDRVTPAPDGRARSGRVLLAARPSEWGRSAEEALRAAGYSVTSVSPHEAWEAMNDLESGPLTAVVIEATPHEPAAGHGHWADLLARLRAGRDTWALPVLVLADGGDEATEVRALRWRATDVVAGTVRPRVLVARLRALLGRADRG